MGLGAYRWVTPHGLGRLVTPTGTRPFTPIHHPDGHIVGEIYDHHDSRVRVDFGDYE